MNSSLRLIPTCSCSYRLPANPKPTSLSFLNNPTHLLHLNRAKRKQQLASCTSYEVGGGYPEEELDMRDRRRPIKEVKPKMDTSEYEALLKGGDQVTSVLEEMIVLLEDTNTDETSEEIALQLAAQGVIGKRVDEMESGFMMALDYMIQIAEKDQDDKRKAILEVVKETVLSHLTKKCPPHVQVVGLLCRTPLKESRHELLRRVAAGGGVFKSKNGSKVHIPGANLNDIANQADDLIETMETRPKVPDRKLLARLVLIREEARNMMGGGILDERNDRGLSTLPESEVRNMLAFLKLHLASLDPMVAYVSCTTDADFDMFDMYLGEYIPDFQVNFLTKLVALKPGNVVQEMIQNVMLGKDEGADNSGDDGEDTAGGLRASRGISGRESVSGRKPLPVRPGMFLETVSKVLGGIYSGNESGVTAQHLEWVHQKTLHILEDIAF